MSKNHFFTIYTKHICSKLILFLYIFQLLLIVFSNLQAKIIRSVVWQIFIGVEGVFGRFRIGNHLVLVEMRISYAVDSLETLFLLKCINDSISFDWKWFLCFQTEAIACGRHQWFTVCVYCNLDLIFLKVESTSLFSAVTSHRFQVLAPSKNDAQRSKIYVTVEWRLTTVYLLLFIANQDSTFYCLPPQLARSSFQLQVITLHQHFFICV